jgi:hypothetical protein
MICSGGNKPGELLSINTPAHRRKIVPVVINSIENVRDILTSGPWFAEEVAKVARREKWQPPTDINAYATIVLDHTSGFSDLVVKELLGLTAIPVGKSRKADKGESWSLVSQQQYGQLAIICKELFRDILNLPGNVVLVAQERSFGGKDEVAAQQVVAADLDIVRPTVGPALTPSLASWLRNACDYVVQTFKKPKMVEGPAIELVGADGKTTTMPGAPVRTHGVDYCLRCEPHDVFVTKFRVPMGTQLPDIIVNPTYNRLMQAIRGEKIT